MDKSNCEFYWTEVSKFSSCCSKHNKVFNIGSKCPMYDTHTPLSHMEKLNKKNTSISNSTSNSQAITSNLQEVHIPKRKYVRKVKDSIFERFHNYGIKFDAVVEWEHLFKYDNIKLRNNVSYYKIHFDKGFVKVFKKSIVVILRSKSEIIGLSVREAELISRRMVNDILDQLPQSIKVSNREVVSLHNAFVNHPFAVKEVNVKVDGETRFISDNSKGYSEFEAINPNHAVTDSEAIEQDIVSLIDKGLSREVLAQHILDLVKDREFWAEHQRSHVASIQTLGVNTSKNTESIVELKEVVTKLTNEFKSIIKSNSPVNREEVSDSVSRPYYNPIPLTISKYDSDEQITLKKFLNRKDRIKRLKDDWW